MSSTVLPKTHLTVPPELFLGESPHAGSMLTHPMEQRFYPVGGIGQTFRAQDKLRFRLSGNRILDPRSVRMHYRMKIKTTKSNTDVSYDKPLPQVVANSRTAPENNPANDGYNVPNLETIDTNVVVDTGANINTSFRSGRTLIGRDVNSQVEGIINPPTTTNKLASWRVVWPCEHASSIIQEVHTSFNRDDPFSVIPGYNRIRGMMAEMTIDDEWKRSHGQIEGYLPSKYPVDGYRKFSDSDESTAREQWENGYKLFINDQANLYRRYREQFLVSDGAGLNKHRKAVWNVVQKTNEQITYHSRQIGFGNDNNPAFEEEKNFIAETKTKLADKEYQMWQTPLDLVPIFAQPRMLDMTKFDTLNLDMLLDFDDVVLNYVNKDKHLLPLRDCRQEPFGEAFYYEIVDVYITAMTYIPHPGYEASLQQAAVSSGLRYHCDGYKVVQHKFTSLTPQIEIPQAIGSLKSVYVFFADWEQVSGRNNDDYCVNKNVLYNGDLENNYTPVDLNTALSSQISRARINVTNTFPNYGLKRYRFLLDGKEIHSHAVICGRKSEDRAIHELQKAFRLHGENIMGSKSVSVEAFHQDMCIIGLNVESVGLRSGHKLKKLVLDLEFEDPGPDDSVWQAERQESFRRGMTAYVVLHYDQTLVMLGDKNVVSIQ